MCIIDIGEGGPWKFKNYREKAASDMIRAAGAALEENDIENMKYIFIGNAGSKGV